MIFWILTPVPPPPPRTWVPLLGGEGGQSVFAYSGRCVYLDLGPGELFFLYMDLLTHGGGSRVPTPGTLSPPPTIWPLASEDLAVFTLGRLFSGT